MKDVKPTIKKPRNKVEKALPITPTEEVPAEVSDVVISDVINNVLTKYNITEKLLVDMEEVVDTLNITDISDKEGYEKVDKFRISVKNTRSLAVKLCKSGRAEHIRLQKAWIERENYYEERFKLVEDKCAAKQAFIDEQKNKIKQEKALQEQKLLQERSVTLIQKYGMTFDGESYNLGDVKVAVLSLKTADDFVWTTIIAQVESVWTKFEAIKEEKRLKDELAAAEARRVAEENLARAEQLRKQEELINARQKALDEAEAKAKMDAEILIKQKEEAITDLFKSRKSELFAQGFSQTDKGFLFQEIIILEEDILNKDAAAWQHFMTVISTEVTTIKIRLENERLAELDKVKETAAINERLKIEVENQAKALKAKAEEEAILKENARLAAALPNLEKVKTFFKTISDLPLPECTGDEFKVYVLALNKSRELWLKDMYFKIPK